MWNEKPYKKSFRWPQGVRLPILISVHHQSEEATCRFRTANPILLTIVSDSTEHDGEHGDC